MKELTIHYTLATVDTTARVRVSYRPQEGAQAQEREADFNFTVSDQERQDIQWYLEEYLLYPWGEFTTRAERVEEMMEQLGVRLFDAVFGTRETIALYTHVADDLANTRVVIHASDPDGIALPWELMRDSTRGEFGDLARLAHAFVRSQSNLSFQPPAALSGSTTFNILMVICRPGGEGDIPFQTDARPLLELFRPHRDRIRLDILRPPTFEELGRVLNDKPNFYHVLHFDGHGAFPPQGIEADGLLLFEGETDEPRPVTGEDLGKLLAGKGVPVVMLNACQSGMTHPESVYPSVANQLLKAGVGGVVAMTYSVYVQTSVRFVARLYEALIKGEEVARAVTLAREELITHSQRFSPIGEVPLRDWIVPVLFEAVPVRVISKSLSELRLNPNLLQDKQARTGAEIDLPEPPAFGFVGRDGVTLDLERAFRPETIVLLEGMAGVGKTEIATGFARWWAETGALNGPSFFFRFERYLPLAQVCDRVGQVFGAVIQQQLQVDWDLLNADQRREVALSVLKQVPCMLIWDNFEPVAGFPAGTASAWKPEEQTELRNFLSELRGGKTKVLITSRRNEPWLGPIYRRVEIGGLKLAEAQELAVRVLKRAGLNTNQIRLLPQYNDLLRYLRGNPLAIQAILPELKRTTPEALLRALQAGELKLSEDDPSQGRERSLSASLTYRLDALDLTLRQRLAVLALFQGFVNAMMLAGISQEVDGAPDALKGLGLDEWIKILDAATEVGLLRSAGKGYYTVHPALPWFFHDLLREAFPNHLDWLEQAFSTVYSSCGRALFQTFNTNTELAMALLRAEESNLIHALQFTRRHALWDEAQGILYGLDRLLVTQGRWVEWERLIDDIEAEVTDANGKPKVGAENLWLSILGHRSGIASYRRNFDEVERISLIGKAHFEREGDERNLAASLHGLGMLAQRRRKFDEAERWYQQSLVIDERLGDEHAQSSILHQLGMLAQERQQLDEAERWYKQSLAIEERLGNQHGQSATLNQLGRIAEHRRQFDEAERRFRQSLAISESLGEEYGQANTLHNLGAIALMRGQPDEAERCYRQSLAIRERIGDKHGIATSLFHLGVNAEGKGNISEAIRFYERAEILMAELDDTFLLKIVTEALRRARVKKEEEKG